jgi:hypothetical protein
VAKIKITPGYCQDKHAYPSILASHPLTVEREAMLIAGHREGGSITSISRQRLRPKQTDLVPGEGQFRSRFPQSAQLRFCDNDFSGSPHRHGRRASIPAKILVVLSRSSRFEALHRLLIGGRLLNRCDTEPIR